MSEDETDDENAFTNQETNNLSKLGFGEGEIEMLVEICRDSDIGFAQIRDEYMRVLRLPQEDGGFGIDDVTYDQIIMDDNFLIPGHPTLRKHTVSNRVMYNLWHPQPETGGRRNKRRSKKRRTNKRRSNKRRTNKRR